MDGEVRAHVVLATCGEQHGHGEPACVGERVDHAGGVPAFLRVVHFFDGVVDELVGVALSALSDHGEVDAEGLFGGDAVHAVLAVERTEEEGAESALAGAEEGESVGENSGLAPGAFGCDDAVGEPFVVALHDDVGVDHDFPASYGGMDEEGRVLEGRGLPIAVEGPLPFSFVALP